MYGNQHVFENLDALYLALLSQWRQNAAAAIAERGAFHVSLAGGNTPRGFYAALAQDTANEVDLWRQTHVYFGDERCVPQDHPDSNYRMAREALLSKVPVPAEHVHPMYDAVLSVEENVAQYARLLQDTLPQDAQGHPVFDLVLLGMGDDGHTASLFPGTGILDEYHQPVAAQFVEKLNAWRISLTFATLNAARHVVILVAGDTKADILAEIFSAPEDVRYPIQRVRPQGRLDWYLDAAAASLLPGGA